jgi:hypothetical protein
MIVILVIPVGMIASATTISKFQLHFFFLNYFGAYDWTIVFILLLNLP